MELLNFGGAANAARRLLGRADFFDTIQYTGPKAHSYENWLKNNHNPPK